MDRGESIVIALGGNAISRQNEEGNIHEQFANTRASMEIVAQFISLNYRVLITHGNGPQVGNELIRVEGAADQVPTLPLGIIVADTEGGMGYMIEQCLQNVLHDSGMQKEIACIITQVVIDPEDPAMKNPTKFVGPFFREERVQDLKRRGWSLREDSGRGWRQVVPSPKPKSIVEKNTIKLLVENDVVVICGGGGGVPVYTDPTGWLEGVDAVIDKDLASALIAREIQADILMILTAVDNVAINFGKPHEQPLTNLTVAEAEDLLVAGHFPAGSMGPKIEAACDFLRSGGKRVIITSITQAIPAINGEAGTTITN